MKIIPTLMLTAIFAYGAVAPTARTLEVRNNTVDEESGFVDVRVELSSKILNNNMKIHFDWETINGATTNTHGSAIDGSDFTGTAHGTATFVKNENPIYLRIPILDDLLPEKDEQFYVRISNVTIENPAVIGDTVTITDSTAIITIRDTDIGENPIPIMYVQDTTVQEDVGTMYITVRMTEAVAEDVTFDYAISGDSPPTATSASPTTDFITGSGQGVILAGEFSTTIAVPIVDDLLPEDTESFPILISNASHPEVIMGDGANYHPYAKGIIVDNDQELSIFIQDSQILEGNSDGAVNSTITLSRPLDYDLVITLSTGSANSANPDYDAQVGIDYEGYTKTVVFPRGTTSLVVQTTIKGDAVQEKNEVFLLKMDSILHTDGTVASELTIPKDTSTITILDDDTPSACSEYMGLVTINEVQNNPNYRDPNHPLAGNNGMVKGSYVEIKYIDFLAKQHVTSDWTIEVIGQNSSQTKQWSAVDDSCADPRYDIFFFDSQYMGSTETLVVLRDGQGNRVDEFNLNNKEDTEGAILNCPYLYDTRIVDGVGETASDKDYYRDPDGTGDWDRTGNGANSGGSQCINKDAEGLLFTKFDAIDTDEIIPDPVLSYASVPLKTKTVETSFDENIISINVDNGRLIPITTQIKVYLADVNGEKLVGNNPPIDVSFENDSVTFAGGFVYPDALRQARLYFEYCVNGDWSDCFGTADNLDARRKSNSRNIYAIKPQSLSAGFGSGVDTKTLKAGEQYPITIDALSPSGINTNGYTIVAENYSDYLTADNGAMVRYLHDLMGNQIADSSGVLQGTAEINTSVASYMYNGHSKATSDDTSLVSDPVGSISYSNVGRVSIPIQDRDWATIDADDSPADCTSPYSRWVCGNIEGTFIPDHFTISEMKIGGNDGDSDIVYLANERDKMGAKIHAKIEARNAKGGVTSNFKKGQYENPVSITIKAQASTEGVDSYTYPDANESDISNAMIDFGSESPNADDNGTRTIKMDETAYPLAFNFKRVINEPHNPFSIDGSRVSMEVKSLYSGDLSSIWVKGERIGDNPDVAICVPATEDSCVQENADGKATFYFARAKSSKEFYENVETDNILTPVGVDVFCDGILINCADYNITAVTSERTDEREWHLWKEHKQSTGFGNIALKIDTPLIEGSGTNTATIDGSGIGDFASINVENSGINSNVTVGKGAMGRPSTVAIEHILESDGLTSFTDQWLLFNADADTIPSPFYKVRFKDGAGWNGVGETGSVTHTGANSKKLKKMNW